MSIFNFFRSLWQSGMVSADQHGSAGLGVNVDGTPMLDDVVDVMGKPYGVSSMFDHSHDHGGMFDGGISSSTSTDWS